MCAKCHHMGHDMHLWIIHIIPECIYSDIFHICSLQWRHNGRDGVSNYQLHDCLLNRLFRLRSKKISKVSVTGLCEGNLPVTGEFPARRASKAENVSIWWRHHVCSNSNTVILCTDLEYALIRYAIIMWLHSYCPSADHVIIKDMGKLAFH